MPELSHCPLCGEFDLPHFHRDRRREYRRCQACGLVVVPPKYYLDSALERAEYDKHQNNPEDAGYRCFLSRLAEPLLARIAPASSGLDFGCGPGPVLAQILEEAGHRMALYDINYHREKSVLEHDYDFICATEVVEHLHRPREELQMLWKIIREKGYLAIMTKLVQDLPAFERWHYKNDPTHVCFFSRDTWRWWARCYGAQIEFFGSDVVLFRKPGG
ncbi:MAG: class I SAM-dependent methyltransferase [Halioglobus sp.]